MSKASDAARQSATKCSYHKWIKASRIEIQGEPVIRCKTCGAFPTAKETKRAESIVELREILKPGDTVYTILKSVSRSGMSRNIDLYIMRDNRPVWITSYVGHALECPQSRSDWEKSAGLKVHGAGMDMGFHLVYSLGRVLFPDGFAVKGTGRNGDTSGHDNDGGYALSHRWL